MGNADDTVFVDKMACRDEMLPEEIIEVCLG